MACLADGHNYHNFQENTQSTQGVGRGSMVVVCVFKMLIVMSNIIMHTGSLKINIFKVLFWEGVRCCNVDNYGRPCNRTELSVY